MTDTSDKPTPKPRSVYDDETAWIATLIQAENVQLRDENARLREALEAIANGEGDAGEIARQTLASAEGQNNG